MISANGLIFPVVVGIREERDGEEGVKINIVMGTAFAISENYFATAAHVITACLEDEDKVPGLVYFDENGGALFQEIEEYEIFENCDIALLEVEGIPTEPLPWNGGELPVLNNIFTMGYPYAFYPVDEDINHIKTRGFKGYIVSTGPHYDLSSHPLAYELDFLCPRGISGSPLLRRLEDGNYVVKGIIIASKSTSMVVSRLREEDSENNTTTIYERSEILHLGIAIQSSVILEIWSDLLDDYLVSVLNLS